MIAVKCNRWQMDVAEHGMVLSIGSGRSVDALSRRLFRYLDTHCMQRARRNSDRLIFFFSWIQFSFVPVFREQVNIARDSKHLTAIARNETGHYGFLWIMTYVTSLCSLQMKTVLPCQACELPTGHERWNLFFGLLTHVACQDTISLYRCVKSVVRHVVCVMYTRFKSFELITWFELRKYFIMRTPYLFAINTVDCNLVRPTMFSELDVTWCDKVSFLPLLCYQNWGMW